MEFVDAYICLGQDDLRQYDINLVSRAIHSRHGLIRDGILGTKSFLFMEKVVDRYGCYFLLRDCE